MSTNSLTTILGGALGCLLDVVMNHTVQSIEGISANVSEREFAALEPTIKRFNSHYEDIEPGDRYALTFANGTTELAKNGHTLGAVEGTAFARAIFAIWLGEEPLSRNLKSALLGAQ